MPIRNLKQQPQQPVRMSSRLRELSGKDSQDHPLNDHVFVSFKKQKTQDKEEQAAPVADDSDVENRDVDIGGEKQDEETEKQVDAVVSSAESKAEGQKHVMLSCASTMLLLCSALWLIAAAHSSLHGTLVQTNGMCKPRL